MGDKAGFGSDGLLPIPTYEEATSSRPSSSQSYLGPAEVSADAERQGLLGRDGGLHASNRINGYRPPTVESARSSLDGFSDAGSGRASAEELRREISEMDIVDPPPQSSSLSLSKRISNFRLSSLHLPFTQWLPSFSSVRSRLSNLPNPLSPMNSILLLRFMALLFVLTLGYLVFFTSIFRRPRGQSFREEDVRVYLQGQINQTRIMENLEHVTKWDHIAGTEGSFFLANWIEKEMEAAGLDTVDTERFDVYLNYPKAGGRRVAIVEPEDKRWEAKIEEDQVYGDRDQTMVFHGHSKSGNVTGPLIYANYGSRKDFEDLKKKGISVNGAVVLVRYYGSQPDRSLKVKAAEQEGAVGCIEYSDPKEDGFLRGKDWPHGRYMPADGVQRGSVNNGWVLGDPLSPGFASLPGEPKRLSPSESVALPKIPSIPLAWRDAQPLLRALKGHGKTLNEDGWTGGVPDVEWWTGDDKSPKVNLANEQDERTRHPIYNILGTIAGMEQGENPIILGNHHDAWCYGATDPGSGTAVFLEVLRAFGDLKREGWRPRRTIQFASWDAEEYNMVGSTEHVEARLEELRSQAFAYVNVDVAVQGDEFEASASPVYETILMQILKRVGDPVKGKSLFQLWQEKKSKLEALGSGSDYVAFQDLAGISSLDLTFGGPKFPYHSCYDNFDWMARFGDPGFIYHKLMGEVLALTILQLADEPLFPFNLEAYARAIKGYIRDLEKYAADKAASDPNKSLNVQSLIEAAAQFAKDAKTFHEWGREWQRTIDTNYGREIPPLTEQRLEHNRKVAKFEADLLDLKDGVSLRNKQVMRVFADM